MSYPLVAYYSELENHYFALGKPPFPADPTNPQ